MIDKLKELFQFRELIINLARKDFKVRYKTATLGFLWAFLNPLFMMIILTMVFSYVMKIQIENYPVFLLVALIPWTFFTFSISNSTPSIVENGILIKRVYFPREIIPISINLANLINFLLSMGLLIIFLLILKVRLTWHIAFLPLVIILQILLNIGFALITSSLHVYYRDVKYIVEVLLMLLFYATPIFYSIDMVPERFQKIYMLNPMADIVTLYRNILIEGQPPRIDLLFYSIVTSMLFLAIGFIIFRRYEQNFADIV